MPHTIWTVTANLLMIFISERKSSVHNGGVETDALTTDRSPSLRDSIFGSHPPLIIEISPKSLRNCLLSEDRNSVWKYPQQILSLHRAFWNLHYSLTNRCTISQLFN